MSAPVNPFVPRFDLLSDWMEAWGLYRNTPYREDCAAWIAREKADDPDIHGAALAVAEGCEASARELTALADEAIDLIERPWRDDEPEKGLSPWYVYRGAMSDPNALDRQRIADTLAARRAELRRERIRQRIIIAGLAFVGACAIIGGMLT